MTGPLPAFLSPLTVPAAAIYRQIIQSRNARFNRGAGVQRIDRPVISIGNITTGGTGKTPMVMWIAQRLLEHGCKPAIAMRGYRSTNGTSDEQMEYADRLPNVPVIAHPDRAAALRAFLPLHAEIGCVILDDGFQHRQLHRDLDLVLIDASADTFRDRLLPAGHLREPLENLRRADGVIITHAEALSESEFSDLKFQIERFHTRPVRAVAQHVWTSLEVHDSNGVQSCEVAWLNGRRMLTMLGIGNPKPVIATLEKAGGIVAVNIPCSDHERFDRAKLAMARGLAEGCDAMLITAKDWVKLRNLIDCSMWPVPIVVPRLQLEVCEGALELQRMIAEALRC